MKRLLILALLCVPAFGQSWYGNNAYTTTYINGTRVVNVIPGVKVRICSNVSGACQEETVYSDQAMSDPITQPMPVDGQGNFGFWISDGTYSYRILNSQGVQIQGYPFTVGGGSGGTSVNVNGSPVSNPNFNGSTPSPDSGYTPVTWKVSGSSVLGEVPAQLSQNGQCNLGLTGLVGAFTDGTGVIKQVLCLGNGPTTLMVPSGATQLLLGVNDDKYADNAGSWTIDVAVNGGATTPVTINGNAMPWSITTNPTYTYGINDGGASVIAATGLSSLDSVVVTYSSGTVWSGNAGFPYTDANGSLSKGTTGSGKGSTGTYFPTLYMNAAWTGGAITALTGDVTATGPGSAVATLATVNSSPGTCGDATHVCQVTVNAKGLTTTMTPVSITGTGGVTSINSATGAFIFSGAGVSCTGTTCTFSGGGGSGTIFCAPNAQTGTTYTLALTDGTASGAACIGTVTMTNASNNTVTVPPNSGVALPTPDEIDLIQLGVGQTCFVAGAGVTLTTPTSLCARAQNSTIGIRQISANTWIVFGDTQ